MAHVVAWMTPLDEGLRPYQLQKMLMFVSRDCELSESFVLSANNSSAHVFIDMAALDELGLDFEEVKEEVSKTLLPVLENWENESEDCFYTTPVNHLCIFMGCDYPTEQLNGSITGVVQERRIAKTFRDLRDALNTLTDEQLDSTLTLYRENEDEFYSVAAVLECTNEDDVLDKDHPYLQFISSLEAND